MALGRETAYEARMSEALLAAVASLPYLVIDVVALVLAVARWNKHPKVSMLVAVATALQLLVRGLFMVGPLLMARLGGPPSLHLFSALASLLGAVGLALLVAAVFAERPDPAGPPQQRW